MKLKCVIIDDEPVARKVLREFVEDIDYLELLGLAENPLQASGLLSISQGLREKVINEIVKDKMIKR